MISGGEGTGRVFRTKQDRESESRWKISLAFYQSDKGKQGLVVWSPLFRFRSKFDIDMETPVTKIVLSLKGLLEKYLKTLVMKESNARYIERSPTLSPVFESEVYHTNHIIYINLITRQ